MRLQGFTALQYHSVCGHARAGRVDHPLVTRFISAFCTAIGLDADTMPWTAEERAYLLQWLGLVPRGAWTALDELHMRQVLGGAT